MMERRRIPSGLLGCLASNSGVHNFVCPIFADASALGALFLGTGTRTGNVAGCRTGTSTNQAKKLPYHRKFAPKTAILAEKVAKNWACAVSYNENLVGNGISAKKKMPNWPAAGGPNENLV